MRLTFDPVTYILWADKDGNGTSKTEVPIALLKGVNTLSITDIFVF